MDPKVSVIVPVYNTEKYLNKCLNSLVNQTLDDIEIIVINDGSTDGSAKIIERYEKSYPQKIKVVHQENQGQAVARNKGLKLCRGSYIGFLDSDDYVRQDMFEKLYNKAIHEDLDYVGCGYTDFTYQDGKKVILSEYTGQPVCKNPNEMFLSSLVSPFINFYKRRCLDESKASFPEKVIYEDTAFFAEIIPSLKRIGYIEEPLAYRLRRKQSTTTIVDPKKIGQIFQVLNQLITHYEKMNLLELYHIQLEYFCTRILLCSSLQRVSMIKKFRSRQKLIRQTYVYLKKHFPEYRKNPYLDKGKKNLYMKYSNPIVMTVVCEVFHHRKKGIYV